MTVFLDANILFSACYKRGGIHELITMMQMRGIVLCTDQRARDEAMLNLQLKKPLAMGALQHLLSRMVILASSDHIPQAVATLSLPPADALVFAAALECRATTFLTGDRKHFGIYFGTTIESVTVLSPSLMLERLEK